MSWKGPLLDKPTLKIIRTYDSQPTKRQIDWLTEEVVKLADGRGSETS